MFGNGLAKRLDVFLLLGVRFASADLLSPGVRRNGPSSDIHAPHTGYVEQGSKVRERDGRPFYSQRDLWEAPVHNKRQAGTWVKQIQYSGTTFFDGMNFFSEPDPSNGLVQYVDSPTAFSEGLAFWTSDGTPGLQAEHWAHTEEGVPRKSVRIHTKALFQGGLFLVDMGLFPWGCGVWPAVWLLGYDQEWPYAGEIDIIEGIQAMTNNQMTIHTAPGCDLDQSAGLFSGTVANSNCDSTSGNSGCSIVSSSNVSFGMRFNELGGGVFACLWDDDGIRMYSWTRSAIPLDIHSEEPNITSWGEPVAAWSSSKCDPWAFFHPQQMVLNVNLCGDWAGQNYGQYPYCPGTCASCITDPNNMNNTVMIINSIKVYQQAGKPVVTEQASNVNNQTGAAGFMGRPAKNRGTYGGSSSPGAAPRATSHGSTTVRLVILGTLLTLLV